MTDQDLRENLMELTPCQSGTVNSKTSKSNAVTVRGSIACGHSSNTPDTLNDIAQAIDARKKDELNEIATDTGFIFTEK